MRMNNPILFSAFFAPHMMLQHWNYCLRSPTPLVEESKRDFTPMTVSPGQSADTSPGVFFPTFDTYDLLLSVRDVLSTLQLYSEGKVIDDGTMQEDLRENEVPHE